jgi:hypothetical protein
MKRLDLRRLAKGLLVTILETAGLTLWLITYIPPPYIDPAKSTILLFLFLFPEHYIAIGPTKR